MSNLQRLAHSLGMIEAILDSLDDHDVKWFEDRGVAYWDLNNLRLCSKSVSIAFHFLPSNPKLKPEHQPSKP